MSIMDKSFSHFRQYLSCLQEAGHGKALVLDLLWLCTPFGNTARGFHELLSRRSAYPRELMNRFLSKPVREPLSAFTPAELPKAYNCCPIRQQSQKDD